MTNIFFPFHLVELSPWPLFTGFCALRIILRLVVWFKFHTRFWFLISFFMVRLIAFLWWRDVRREATFQGFHNSYVQHGLKLGIGLFIFSEVIFFSAFFWTFFHRRIAPSIDIGLIWPPTGLHPLNPFQVPLLNTAILLSRGVTVTWRHHRLIRNQSRGFRLLSTVILGVYFTTLQGFEYYQAEFTLSDSVYGRIFFVATGFHGLHVIIGSSLLLYCLIRIRVNHFSFFHHIGYEMAIWYWHFVDVVWLFLFSIIYWWGF